MYTELESYQIIIALLKKYNIRNLVLSAGSRNVPFVHSVEKDSFFKCYSVVDERSAGYFALGLSQRLNEPVVISCTSSTAATNYWPPVAEAFYQGVPLVVLTSDRDPAMLHQWEDQMIDQVGMFKRHVKKSVNLPLINDHDDWIFCQRLVNEALLELDHHGKGPVHINIPMRSYNKSFNVKELPHVTKINRFTMENGKESWNKKISELSRTSRILVTAGQNSHSNDKLSELINEFNKRYNSVVVMEYMSNLELDKWFNGTILMDSRYITTKKMKELLPDIVISFGGNVFSGIKGELQKFAGHFEHWSIQPDGRVVDMYKGLTDIFECTPEYFFDYAVNKVSKNIVNNSDYVKLFNEYQENIIYPKFEYSDIWAIKNVVENIPEHSNLHLSINDSIRITNFFKLKKDVRVYANIGTHGIDGCLSSFLGQAAANSDPSFLIIGDLSFFYGMNALRLKSIGSNVHILLINNHGGSEFYFNKMYIDKYSDLHTTARHNSTAKGWVESNNFEYFAVHNKKEFEQNIDKFMGNNNKPTFMEVFTEMSTDAEQIYKFFDLSRPRDIKSEVLRRSKDWVKTRIGQQRVQRFLNIFK